MKQILSIALFSVFAFGQHGPHIFPVRGASQAQSAATAGTVTTSDGNGIDYHGGPLLLGTPTVYVIWYGNWTPSSAAVPIVTNLLQNIGGSPYEGVNATYHDGSAIHISGLVSLGAQVYDAYSLGSVLTDSNIQSIVAAHIGHDLPVDTNALYFVLTSGDVSESGPFGTFGGTYCGWHNQAPISGLPINFSFVGDPSLKYSTTCQLQTPGPNGSSGGDGIANVAAHELEEAITDPDAATGWYDSSGAENADKCAWTFGSIYKAPNGAWSNVKIGGMDYLIQQNWLNAGGGYCSMVDNSTAIPKVTILSPASGASFTCDQSGNVYVPVSASAIDSHGNNIPSSSINVAVTYQFWCSPDHSCGESNEQIAWSSSATTFTVPCSPLSPNYSVTYAGKGWAQAMDSSGNTAPWSSVDFSVLPYVAPQPPPPPPPPPTCTPNNKHSKNCH